MEFKHDGYEFPENGGSLVITVVREKGTRGPVQIFLEANNGTAKNYVDFTFGLTQIEFTDGQVCKILISACICYQLKISYIIIFLSFPNFRNNKERSQCEFLFNKI